MGEDAVDVGVEGGAFLLVGVDEFFWGEDGFFFVGVAAEVEVVIALDEFGGGKLLGFVEVVDTHFFAVVPPLEHGVEVFAFHGFCLGEVFVARGHIETVDPCFGGGGGVVEEEDVGRNRGVGGEDAVWEADDGVEVELGEELSFDGDFGVVGAEEEAIGEDDGGASVLFEAVHDDGHEEVGGFAAGEVGGEVVFDLGFFVSAVGWIHEDDIKAVFLCIVEDVVGEGVVVVDLGDVDVVQEHIGNAEQVGEGFFLDAVNRGEEGFAVGRCLNLLTELFEPAGEEASGAAGEVCHCFADLGADDFCHEVGDGAGGVEFAGGAGALEFFEDVFVDVAEGVAFFVAFEVEFVDDIDDLSEEDAVFHIVVGIGEGGLDDGFFEGCFGGDGETFEGGKEGVVDEVEEGVAGHGFAGAVVFCPGAPTAVLRDDGGVVLVVYLPVGFFGVVDFEEEHPCHLFNALGIAVDTGVVPHDVANTFDEGGEVVHD